VPELIIEGVKREDSPGIRALNHFYDPVHERGLRVPYDLIPLGMPSPRWGLEDESDVAGQNHSWKDAYGWLHLALTAPEKSDRDRCFATLFETLGRVVHHVGDKAQPEHVRDDAHLDFFGEKIEIRGLEDPSLYERYTELFSSA
jgi:hypothetical protein